jgi:hypothetical protein
MLDKIKIILLDLGIIKKEYPKSENCINCGRKLEGKQKMFCNKKCASYYHNIKEKNE